MYNDEENFYHYTYRKSGEEPAQQSRPSVDEQMHRYEAARTQAESAGEQKSRSGKSHLGLKIAALALACAVLGGAAGAGIATAMQRDGGGKTSVQTSSRPASEVSVKKVDGKTAMSDAENYVANVNSVVSINCSSTSTNYFGQTVQNASSGSGFILTADGYIVTNNHVVENATSVKVTLYDGTDYEAGVIGCDKDYDIAVLKVKATELPAVTLGDSDSLNVGDRVLAIGNPLGELTFSMSGGMVSSVNRTINVDGTPFNMIQTDASINPGNSGGPLLNSFGEVVGIVSAKYSSYSTESVEGLGFAIPINDVLAMIQDIMTNGYVTNKAYLGATVGTMTQSMAQQYRYSISKGVFIYSVEEGSAAAKAGLQMGDVITKIGETDISSLEGLTAAKKNYSAGDTCTVTFYRNGETKEVELTWGSEPETLPEEQRDAAGQNGNSGNNPYGQYGRNDLADLFEYFFNNRYGSGR